MSETKLKPCPFCGGEARMVKYCGKKTIVYVECTNCLAYMGNQRIMTSSSRGKEYFENEEKLINAWNTRNPMDNIVAKLEDKQLSSISAHAETTIGMCGTSASYYSGEIDAYNKAIDIVKRGGVE